MSEQLPPGRASFDPTSPRRMPSGPASPGPASSNPERPGPEPCGARRDYGGQTATQRRDERRARLVDAVLSVVARAGVVGVSARSVSDEAGLHARYFRESFDSAEDALAAAYDELSRELFVGTSAAVATAGEGLAAKVRAGVGHALHFFDVDPRRSALLLQSGGGSEELRTRRAATNDALADAMAGFAQEFLGAQAPPLARSRMAAYVLVSGSADLVARHRAGLLPGVTDREVEDLIVAMVLASRFIGDDGATP